MTLDDLKNIDLNNFAAWPYPLKIGAIVVVCLLILGAGYYFVIADELTQLETEKQKEQGLKDTYLSKKAQAINLEAYKQQMEEMGQQFGTLLRQLPNKTEVPNLLVDITQAGLGRGLDFVLFKPERERPLDFYAELPISIKVTGGYHELGLFVSDVASLSRIVTLGEVQISSNDKTNKLEMAAIAKTYRYLEADEIAEQLKAKAAAQKKGAPRRPPARAK
jgi:type IV pilus assembly protein PilO